MMADGSATFAKEATGLTLDLTAKGPRACVHSATPCWSKDGVVKTFNVEAPGKVRGQRREHAAGPGKANLSLPKRNRPCRRKNFRAVDPQRFTAYAQLLHAEPACTCRSTSGFALNRRAVRIRLRLTYGPKTDR